MKPTGNLRWAHQLSRGPGAPERFVLQQEFSPEPGSEAELHWGAGYTQWRDVPVYVVPNEALK